MKERRSSGDSLFMNSNHQRVANQLQYEQNDYLFEQKEYIKELAEAAKQSAQSADKSSKKSFICTILSVVIAGLMLIATIANVVLGVLTYQNSQTNQQNKALQTTFIESSLKK